MKTKLYLTLFSLCFLSQLTVFSQDEDGYVMWVRDQTQDQGFIDILEGLDITVKVTANTAYAGELDQEKLDSLNNATVVVISRSCKSDTYAPIEAWNEIAAPLICLSPWLMRSNRWMWFETEDVELGIGTDIIVQDSDDPIFTGITLDWLTVYENETCEAIGTANVGNGKILAVTAESGNIVMAKWSVGTEFYAGSGQIAGGERYFFSAGHNGTPDESAVYNLIETGHDLFVNLIQQYFVQVGIEDNKAADLSIYPNPASDVLQIDFQPEMGHEVVFSIIDITGKTVLKKKAGISDNKHCEVDISNLEKGIYIINATTSTDDIITQRLIIE